MIYETIFNIIYLIGGFKKNEVTNFQYFSFTFIGSFIVAVIAWPIMNLIIGKKPFKYSIIGDIVIPLIFAILYAIIETLI